MTPDEKGRAVSGSYAVGNLDRDSSTIPREGWLIGAFFEPAQARHTEALEVKFWSFPGGTSPKHPTKVSDTTEWTLVLSGRLRASVGGESLELGPGDYVLIHPGTPNNLVDEVLEPTRGVTVKAPSDPGAKHTVGTERTT